MRLHNATVNQQLLDGGVAPQNAQNTQIHEHGRDHADVST